MFSSFDKKVGNFIDKYLENRFPEECVVVSLSTGKILRYATWSLTIMEKEESRELKKQSEKMIAVENLQRSFWQF